MTPTQKAARTRAIRRASASLSSLLRYSPSFPGQASLERAVRLVLDRRDDPTSVWAITQPRACESREREVATRVAAGLVSLDTLRAEVTPRPGQRLELVHPGEYLAAVLDAVGPSSPSLLRALSVVDSPLLADAMGTWLLELQGKPTPARSVASELRRRVEAALYLREAPAPADLPVAARRLLRYLEQDQPSG